MTRSELYQSVWLRPVRAVAQDLGCSDRWLSSICSKLDIPTPPRGHWRRVFSGQQCETPPLPESATDPEVQIVRLQSGAALPRRGAPDVTAAPVRTVATGEPANSAPTCQLPTPTGIIEIEVGEVRLVLRGSVDVANVRNVLQALRAG